MREVHNDGKVRIMIDKNIRSILAIYARGPNRLMSVESIRFQYYLNYGPGVPTKYAIRKAVRELMDAGLVDSVHRRGCYWNSEEVGS